MMAELKPCPFCGGERIEIKYIRDSTRAYLNCFDCGIEQKIYETKEKAIEAWNTRTPKEGGGEK